MSADPVLDSRDEPPAPNRLSRSLGLILAARPSHWVKNCACFAGLVFSGKLFDAKAVLGAWWVDPVGSLAIVWFLVKEGRDAWAGEECGCG